MVFNPFGPATRSRPSFSAKDKEFLHERQKGQCAGCKEKLPVRNLTVDHIKPLDKGGSDKPSNLQLLCNSCNSIKGNRTQAYLQKRLREQGIVKAPAATSASKKAPSSTKAKTTPKPKKSTKKDPIAAGFEAAAKAESKAVRKADKEAGKAHNRAAGGGR